MRKRGRFGGQLGTGVVLGLNLRDGDFSVGLDYRRGWGCNSFEKILFREKTFVFNYGVLKGLLGKLFLLVIRVEKRCAFAMGGGL